ncbi:MAG: APC family permease [Chthoniobacteraceae bacterium]
MSTQSQPKNGHYGLKGSALSAWETFAQSVANIAPTASPTVVIPLVFGLAGGGTWLAYLFAVIGILFVSWNINQFAKRSASPGSFYVYAAQGLGPTAGALVGWALLVAYIGTGSAVTGGFTNYLHVLLKPWIGGGDLPGVAFSVVFTGVTVLFAWFFAYKDVKLSARLMLALEGISVSLIALIVGATIIRNGWKLDFSQLTLKGVSFDQLRSGLVLAIFSFVGFESATALGAEARNPLKTIPRAVVRSAIFVGLFFVVSSYGLVLGFHGEAETLDKSAAPLNVLASKAGLKLLEPLISAGAVISFFACTLASINAGARILFLMARHGIFPAALGSSHSTNETPHVAVTVSSVLAFVPAAVLAAVGVGPFDIYGWVGAVATYGFIVTYIVIAIAAPVQLYKLGELGVGAVIISALAVITMVIALIGNLYPVPPAPYNWLPYLFLGYLVVGWVWFAVAKRRSANVVEGIHSDLSDIRARFAPES